MCIRDRLLSHGLELWSLAAHFRISRDKKWLGEGPGSPLQSILDAANWIVTQRRRTKREEGGRPVAHWGLLPAASTHDWLSGNTICNDATCIYGLTETVRLLREIGHPRAGELMQDLGDYRQCLRARYREATSRARRLPVSGGKDIPYVPRDIYELDWAETDWTYTGYGPLRAGAWGALDPHDELVEQSLAFLEAGLPKGQGFYMRNSKDHFGHPTADENFRDISDPTAERHHLWKHYVEYETMVPIIADLFLQRDDLDRYFEWFFNNMEISVYRDFRVGVESLDGPPSCAPGDLIRRRAIRNMFANERDGYDGSQQSLWLLQAIPRSWLTPGARLAIRETGTSFGGAASVEAEMARDGNSVSATIRLKLAVVPSEIRLRLRSANGRKLRAALVNGAKVPVIGKDELILPRRPTGEYSVKGYF